jgi:hypothetical protein
VTLMIPARLASVCAESPESSAWLERLPDIVERLCATWSLKLGPAFDHEGVGRRGAGARRAGPRRAPFETVHRLAELLELDHERLRLWTIARLAVECERDLAEMRPGARALAP